MIRFAIIITWLIIFAHTGHAQVLAERMALNSLSKHKWEQARARLKKSLQKDTANLVARYVYARYFFSTGNPNYNLDSAYKYTAKTLARISLANDKQRERMKRFPVDSAIVLKLRAQIDSAAFELSKNVNTEQSYLYFINNFPYAIQHEQAKELRDEVAYLDALKQNTYQSFADFIQKYPHATQAIEAKKRFDKLLFDYKTRDKKLKSYESFLSEYPTSPCRKETERNIFEILTASGKVKTFESFLDKYPEGHYASVAKNILFHLLLENNDDSLQYLKNDSLAAISKLNQNNIIFFLKDGKFAFMDMDGNEIMNAVSNEINPSYRCETIKEDVIVLPDKIVARNGAIIYDGTVESASDLGYGFLKVQHKGKIVVVHKSGFIINRQGVDDVKMVNGNFIALQLESNWSLWTLTGRNLMPHEWDDITAIGEVIVFKKNEKYKLATITQVGLLADQVMLKTKDYFDNLKSFPHQLILARIGDYEGVFDQQLNFKVPFDKHQLVPAFSSIISSVPTGKKFYNLNGDASSTYQDVKVSKLWTAISQDGLWRLINSKTFQYQSNTFDSISFIGPFVTAYKSDSMHIYFNDDQVLYFKRAQLQFIPGKDSISFLLVEEGDKKILYSDNGLKLFTIAFDKIQYAGAGTFIVKKKDKKGLIRMDGKMLLPLEFDAISGVTNNTISVLKNMKFGLYDVLNNKLINPLFDKNLTNYNSQYLIGFKAGFYGLIKWKFNPAAKFEFNEIFFWNDTSALVKKDSAWQFWDIKRNVSINKIMDFSIISDSEDEKILVVNQAKKMGVLSNTRGTIVPAEYNYIKNLGTPDYPLYFAEAHVDDANYLVNYYNKDGIVIQRQEYSEDEYELIFCED